MIRITYLLESIVPNHNQKNLNLKLPQIIKKYRPLHKKLLLKLHKKPVIFHRISKISIQNKLKYLNKKVLLQNHLNKYPKDLNKIHSLQQDLN